MESLRNVPTVKVAPSNLAYACADRLQDYFGHEKDEKDDATERDDYASMVDEYVGPLLAENARLRGALEQFRNELQVVDSSGEGRPLAWFTCRLKRLDAALAGEGES